MIDFGQKVKGCTPTFLPQIENILLRKCTSDITDGRAVLYRVIKTFGFFATAKHIFPSKDHFFFFNTTTVIPTPALAAATAISRMPHQGIPLSF